MSSTICPVAIPGPAGIAGADGTAGVDGINARVTLAAAAVMPAELANVTVTVTPNHDGFAIGQPVFIGFINAGIPAIGVFEVINLTGTDLMTLKNLEDTPNNAYLMNMPPGIVIPIGSRVVPGGFQGVVGSTGTSGVVDAEFFLRTPHASLPSGIAFDGLGGAGIIKIDATGAPSLAVAGTDYQGIDAELTALASTVSAANKLPYYDGPGTASVADFTAPARGLVAQTSIANMRTYLGVPSGTLPVANCFFAVYSGIAQVIASSADTKLLFNSAVINEGASYDAALARYTPPVGNYQFNVRIRWQTLTATETRLWILKNAATVILQDQILLPAADFTQDLTCYAAANGTDYFEAFCWQDSGIAKGVQGTVAAIPYSAFGAHKIN